MKLPSGITSKYVYNAEENYYEFTQPIAGYELGYPLILSPEEYWELVRKESTQSYFREKQQLYENQSNKNQSALKNILPNFRLNSDVLETIFGGDEISLIPQGSIAVDMGVLWQKNDNPSLSPRNRSNLSFDFDQQIRLGMVGKIGERLSINANYDTQATFDFQNLIKISYNPPTVQDVTGIDMSGINTQDPLSNVGNMFKSNEDNILQNIEVGNISMPLTSSLIQGAQSLFGLKTEMKFGRTRVTTVLSEQRSQNNSVVAQGGGTISDFNLTALDYEEDRHFFLSHFFRDQYDEALENYPYVNSQVQITRIEVWMTNRVQRTNNVRNIVALQDLGESNPNNSVIGRHPNTPSGFFNTPTAPYLPSNNANDYDPEQIGIGGALLDQIRDIATAPQAFNTPGYKINPGFDYAVIENAHKLEEGRDYFIDTQLG
ncbi:MAG: cell surface protein SprA, partial [Flavobacteriaceae bacterium]|nr:cell surface protein SprA [Flavobacteriaceae bacterium]